MQIKVSKEKIEVIVITALVILLMAFNSDNPDYINYKVRYDGVNYGGLEVGFGVINLFFYRLGFSFVQFRAIVYIIGTVVMFHSVNKITRNMPFVVASYFVLVMCMDAIQLRNYIATVFIVSAMPFLLKRNIKNDIKFAILCAISTTIHISSSYYFLFLICHHIKKPKKYFIFMMTLCETLIILTYTGITGDIISRLLNNERTLAYTQSRATLGVIIYLAIFIVTAILIKYAFKEKTRTNGEFELFEELRESDLFILNMFITLIPVLALMCMNAIFVRVIRSMFVFLFAFLGNTFTMHRRLSFTKTEGVFVVWMIFMMAWLYGEAFQETYLYIFTNNLLLGA